MPATKRLVPQLVNMAIAVPTGCDEVNENAKATLAVHNRAKGETHADTHNRKNTQAQPRVRTCIQDHRQWCPFQGHNIVQSSPALATKGAAQTA